MNPDLEIIKSLNPDYILSPATLQSDLQPKYAGIKEAALFLDLKSVEGMYSSIEGLGKKFNREAEAKVLLDEFDAFMKDFEDATAGKEAAAGAGADGAARLIYRGNRIQLCRQSCKAGRQASMCTMTATAKNSSQPTPRI